MHKGRTGISDDVNQSRLYGELLKEGGFKLVICDVQSHCYQDEGHGRDENSQGFMHDFFKMINSLKKASGAHILLVHHDKKGSFGGNESASGSFQQTRSVETICSLSRVPDDRNPDGSIYNLSLVGRELPRDKLIWLKAESSKDGACRVFREVTEPVKIRKPRGAPATAEKNAVGILSTVLRSNPDLKGRGITPRDWVAAVKLISTVDSSLCKSEERLKDYLKCELVGVGLVQKLKDGLYQIL